MAVIDYSGTLELLGVSSMRISTTYNVAEDISLASGRNNYVKNTLDNNIWDYSAQPFFNFLVPPVTPPRSLDIAPSFFVTPMVTFDDGVYRCYMAVTYEVNVDEYQNTYILDEYLLVTQNIDAQYALFLETFNPNLPLQVQYAIMLLDYFAQIEALSLDLETNYEAINNLIIAIQQILNAATLPVYFYLSSPSEMTITFPPNQLPSGVYTEQSFTIEQINTGNIYEFGGFPLDQDDETELIIAEDSFGAQNFEDGVYVLSGTFLVDGDTQIVNPTYLLVTTAIDCCMWKFAAKLLCACNPAALDKMATMLTYRKSIDLAFLNGDYSVANQYIKKITSICEGTGCGCGC